MTDVEFRTLEAFPELEFAALVSEAFEDHEPSERLTEVLREEASAEQGLAPSDANALRVGAFVGDRLVGWTFARAEGAHLVMVNSGVAASSRRCGIYSTLVQLAVDHAKAHGHVRIVSRHAANNNAVIIAKLKLGFAVSGFEYSEVYGPLVRLEYIVGELRRSLHRARSTPIRKLDDPEDL